MSGTSLGDATAAGALEDVDELRIDQTLRTREGVSMANQSLMDLGINKKALEDSISNIKVFNGKDAKEFRPWLKQIEKAARTGFYNPHFLASTKSSDAVESFILRNMQNLSWRQMKDSLRSRFSDLQTESDVIKKIRELKQGKTPMATYVAEFEELAVGVGQNECILIEYFIEGIKDSRVKALIRMKWHDKSIRTLQEAFEVAQSRETSLIGTDDDILMVPS